MLPRTGRKPIEFSKYHKTATGTVYRHSATVDEITPDFGPPIPSDAQRACLRKRGVTMEIRNQVTKDVKERLNFNRELLPYLILECIALYGIVYFLTGHNGF